MASLTKILSGLAAEAFAAEGLDPAHGHVTTSDRPDLAQFQCNGALAAAKAAKANPRAIAEKILARLKADTRLAKLEIAGPGFINISLTDAALAAHAAPSAALAAAHAAALAKSNSSFVAAPSAYSLDTRTASADRGSVAMCNTLDAKSQANRRRCLSSIAWHAHQTASGSGMSAQRISMSDTDSRRPMSFRSFESV
jgi:hypothetical protein